MPSDRPSPNANSSSSTSPVILSRADALAQLTAPGQSHEIIDGSVFDRPVRVFANAPFSLRELFDTARSDATFLVYRDANHRDDADRLTFEQTWQQASALGWALVNDYGIEPGDRVAISLRNYPEWVVAYMATTSIGAIAVAMNSWWTPDEMAYGLGDSGAKILIADTERVERFQAITDRPPIPVLAVRAPNAQHDVIDLADVLASASGQPMPSQAPGPEDIASIMYTSGSTGHPKGVASCHRNIIAALMSWELDAAAGALINASAGGPPPPTLQGQDGTLLAVPLFHATGSHAAYLSSYRHQRKIVLMYKWDVARAAELVEQEQVVSFFGPSAMTGDLVAEAARTNRDLSSLLVVGGGGAARAPEQVARIGSTFERALPNTGWGMTETNAIGAGIGGNDYLAHPASSGRSSAVLDLRIVDEAGATLPAGERGELQVRGASIFKGYWNRPDADAETFVAAGDGGAPWMRTGDVAYLDDDGYVYIVDRIKDLVIRGGENIGCGEVEAVLVEHPAVLEACVYAVPDERLGEEVGATLFVDGSNFDEASLREFLSTRLASFQIPRYLTALDEPLPRTASGKILKRQLRAEAAL